MKEKRLYKFIILVLVGLNIAVLAFFLRELKHQDKPSSNEFRSEVAEILKLNDKQFTHFNILADEHKQQMKELEELQAQLLFPYFESLVDTSQSINKDSLLNQLQKSEIRKIELTYQHFEKIKNNLNKDQVAEFKLFVNKITKKFIKK